MEHVNAKDVLPERLLRQVQKYWGGYLYIPETREWYLEKRRRIVRHRRRGIRAETIAKWVGLSARRARQILEEERGRK